MCYCMCVSMRDSVRVPVSVRARVPVCVRTRVKVRKNSKGKIMIICIAFAFAAARCVRAAPACLRGGDVVIHALLRRADVAMAEAIRRPSAATRTCRVPQTANASTARARRVIEACASGALVHNRRLSCDGRPGAAQPEPICMAGPCVRARSCACVQVRACVCGMREGAAQHVGVLTPRVRVLEQPDPCTAQGRSVLRAPLGVRSGSIPPHHAAAQRTRSTEAHINHAHTPTKRPTRVRGHARQHGGAPTRRHLPSFVNEFSLR